jgi:transcriptional regulator with AAA-type ATPase domain
MTNEQYIQRGNLAEALLTQETFQLVANELTQHYIQTSFNTDPLQKETRESCYFQARGLQDLIGVLNQWVAVRDQIIANSSQEEEAYED